MEQRDVLYLSTEFVNNMVEFETRRKQIKIKPLPVARYNENMSGINCKDQILVYYSCERKTQGGIRKYGFIYFK